jgi:hypothetical protein
MLLSFPARAATAQLTAPTKWERYAAKDFGVSFLMPKFPVKMLNHWSGACSSQEFVHYGAYSKGVAYVLRVTRENMHEIDRRECSSAELRSFGKSSFDARIEELEKSLQTGKTEESAGPNEMRAVKITGKETVLFCTTITSGISVGTKYSFSAARGPVWTSRNFSPR